MLIDCDTCAVRGAACGGCVMTTLLGLPRHVEMLDAAEARVIEMLTRAGFEVEVLEGADPVRSTPVTAPARAPRWPHRAGNLAV
jgi:hypothetical protein